MSGDNLVAPTSTTAARFNLVGVAIYELKGDTLRICYELSGAQRPSEFKSIAGTRPYLDEYNRKK